MFYKTGYCFTSIDLLENLNKKELGISTKLYKEYKADTLSEFCAQILTYCFYLIILDIIEKNVTFVFPLNGGREANLSVKCFDGEQFRQMYVAGKFQGIDFLCSNFKGYQIYFYYNYKGGVREKPIYINSALKKKFYENINNGMVYY